MNKNSIKIYKLTISAILLTIGLLLPLLTGQIPEIGNMLCPMHIPVFIAGLALGPIYGGIIGFILPLLRFILFGMPPIYPTGICMSIELLTYGICSGLLIKLFKRIKIKLIISIYLALIISMLVGRIIWGFTMGAFSIFSNIEYSFIIFITSAFINAWPGIILHIILVPAIFFSIYRSHLLDRLGDNYERNN